MSYCLLSTGCFDLQVQVAVTANITLAFLFTGVEWKRPASKALQQAASEAAGGYTQAFVQVEPVEPDYGVSVDAFMNQDLQYTGDGVSARLGHTKVSQWQWPDALGLIISDQDVAINNMSLNSGNSSTVERQTPHVKSCLAGVPVAFAVLGCRCRIKPSHCLSCQEVVITAIGYATGWPGRCYSCHQQQ